MAKRFGKGLSIFVCSLLVSSGITFAQSSSPSFEINEFFVGPGGELDLNSASFNARATLGDLATGNLASSNYQLYGGFTTTDVPYLEAVVNGGTIDMGVLNSTTTGTGVVTFSVRTYLAEGYVVHAGGTLPTNESGDTIDAMSTKGTSSQGTEQFGLNLAVNTSPIVFGAAPVQVPSGTFSFGVVDDEYDDDGQFKYVDTDVVASSSTSSGETLFTASYIMNVSPITEAGLYQTEQSFVVTSTY